MTEAKGSHGTPKTLLLVEDNAIIGLSETRTLEEAGYRVIHVLTGEEAVRTVLEPSSTIDLVLMDVDLGRGMDGTEAARAILQARDVPVVFLSSHTEPELVDRAERITNYGYILKSAGQTVLLASIRMAFRLHDAHAELLRTDEALRRSEQRYAKAFQASPFGIMITRVSDGAILDINDAFVRMSGRSRGDVLGRTSLAIGLWVDTKDRSEAWDQLMEEGRLRDRHVRLRRADGSVMEGLASLDLIVIDGENCIISITADVTESRAGERALRDKEAHYGVLFNELSNAVIEEDFSEVKRRLDRLAASGVPDLDAWLSTHLEDLRDCVRTIRIVDFNQEFLRYLNLTDRSQVAPTINPIIPDASLLILKDEIMALWRGDRTYAISCPNYVEASPVRHMKIRVSLVSGHEDDWSSVLVGLADVSREVQNEEALAGMVRQKDILMRELEHRVKNNLNIVSSLLSLEASKIESSGDRDVFMAAQARIRSISLIYDLLSHSAPGDRISCRAYFQDLALLLKETFAPRRGDIELVLDIPEADIDVKRGVSLGLLANELLTNSFKYAFPDRGGRVELSLRIGDGGIELRVEDDGIGVPEGFSWESSPSLGARLVDMLAQQLRGTVELRLRPGFRTVVRLPLSE